MGGDKPIDCTQRSCRELQSIFPAEYSDGHHAGVKAELLDMND